MHVPKKVGVEGGSRAVCVVIQRGGCASPA